MATATGEEYLFVMGKGNLWSLKDRLDALGGFYAGKGMWFFPSRSYEKLKSLLSPFNELEVIRQQMAPGSTFESWKHSHNANYFKGRLKLIDEEIAQKIEGLDLKELSEEIVDSLEIDEDKKNGLKLLLHERGQIKFQISHKESMAEALSAKKKPIIELKFISEISDDYFKNQPPPKPRLLYYNDGPSKKVTFLHKEIVAMLVAEGGLGKSHLSALLAACVCTGIPFLDVLNIESPGAVALFIGENSDGDIHRLLWKIRKHLEELLKEKEYLLPSDDPLKLLSERLLPVSVHGIPAHFIDANGEKTDFYYQCLEQLEKKEPEEGFQLLIFDPISRFAGPESEKDNAVATAFIAACESLSAHLKGNPTIMLTHHKSKAATRGSGSSQTDGRGSSAFTDGSRWQASLRKDDDPSLALFEVTKTNFTAYPKKIRIKKNEEGIPEFAGWEEKERASQEEMPNQSKSKPKNMNGGYKTA